MKVTPILLLSLLSLSLFPSFSHSINPDSLIEIGEKTEGKTEGNSVGGFFKGLWRRWDNAVEATMEKVISAVVNARERGSDEAAQIILKEDPETCGKWRGQIRTSAFLAEMERKTRTYVTRSIFSKVADAAKGFAVAVRHFFWSQRAYKRAATSATYGSVTDEAIRAAMQGFGSLVEPLDDMACTTIAGVCMDEVQIKNQCGAPRSFSKYCRGKKLCCYLSSSKFNHDRQALTGGADLVAGGGGGGDASTTRTGWNSAFQGGNGGNGEAFIGTSAATTGSSGAAPSWILGPRNRYSHTALAGMFGDSDLLFEGWEHKNTFPFDRDITNAGAGLDSKVAQALSVVLKPLRYSIENPKEVLHYSDIIPLAGDFFGQATCPISTGPVGSNSWSSRRRVIDKLARACNWGAADLLATCPEGLDRGSTMIRFRFSFENLATAEPRYIRRLVNDLKHEGSRITSPETAFINYLGMGDQFTTLYTARSGGGTLKWPQDATLKVLPLLPMGSDFITLATVNWDHFGFEANGGDGPNVRAYLAGHAVAMEMARKAGQTNDLPLLQRAFAHNAFADHFLTDMFAAGHARAPRKELHERITPAFVGDLLSKMAHDEDNLYGLQLTSPAGGTWQAYGDKRWFDNKNKENRARAHAAVTQSILDVALAFAGKQLSADGNMRKFLPKVSPANPTKSLFNRQMQVRASHLDDPFARNPTYETMSLGAKWLMKLRGIAGSREYGAQKHLFLNGVDLSDGNLDGRRACAAMAGTGFDAGVLVNLLSLRTAGQIVKMKAGFAYTPLCTAMGNAADFDQFLADQKTIFGKWEKVLIKTMANAKDKDRVISDQEAFAVAQTIVKAGRWLGTDEQKIIDALGNLGLKSIAKVEAVFPRAYGGKSLRNFLESEFSGGILDLLLTLIAPAFPL